MDQEFKDEFLLDDPEAEGIDTPDTDDESEDEDEEAPAEDETM